MMREMVFNLVVFATGIAVGVVLASYLFERKRREVMDQIDVSLDTIGIKRCEFDALVERVAEVESCFEIGEAEA